MYSNKFKKFSLIFLFYFSISYGQPTSNEWPNGEHNIRVVRSPQRNRFTTFPKTTSPPVTTPATTPSVKITRSSAEIVEQKCQEYGVHRFVNKLKDSYRYDCAKGGQFIAGGTRAEPKEFPHMALIGYGSNANSITWGCGGSLISEQFVLSAAHCSEALGGAKWVRLGDLNITSNTDDAKPKTFEIEKRIIHPQYKDPEAYNDIVLFQLKRKVDFDAYIRPTCLYTSPVLPENKNGVITGWGYAGAAERRSDHLLKAAIPFVDFNRCNEFYKNSELYPTTLSSDKLICAGDLINGRDTCRGDSGGPLQITIELCLFTQLGITSVGPRLCGNNENAATYTKVSAYIDWIQPIVWPQ